MRCNQVVNKNSLIKPVNRNSKSNYKLFQCHNDKGRGGPNSNIWIRHTYMEPPCPSHLARFQTDGLLWSHSLSSVRFIPFPTLEQGRKSNSLSFPGSICCNEARTLIRIRWIIPRNEAVTSRAWYQNCRKWMFWVRNLHPERAIYGNVYITF